MKKPGGGSFRADGLEAQPRSTIRRSSSSEALLDSAPSSHCMAAVAGGDEEVIPTPAKATGLEKEKRVLIASPERPSSAAVVAEGCGGQRKGAPSGYVGRLFSNMGSSVGVAGGEADGTSSQGEEQEREGMKGKQKKKWSWRPDLEKRWPVQGW